MSSILRAVTGSSSSNTISSTSPANDLGKRLAKWVLVIGVPTAVCVAGYLVYRQQQEQAKKSVTRRSPLIGTTKTTITSSVAIADGDADSTAENRLKVIVRFIY